MPGEMVDKKGEMRWGDYKNPYMREDQHHVTQNHQIKGKKAVAKKQLDS